MNRDKMSQIIQSMADEATPRHFDLWARIQQQVQPVAAVQRRWRGFAALSAAAIVMVLFIVVWVYKSAPAVNTIVAGAEPTATPSATPVVDLKDLNTVPLKGFQGVISLDNNRYQWQVWYEAPNRWRVEYFTTTPRSKYTESMLTALKMASMGTPISDNSSVVFYADSVGTSDGTRAWRYDPWQNGVDAQDPKLELPAPLLNIRILGSEAGAAAYPSLITSLEMTRGKVILVGEGTFLNRSVLIFDTAMQPNTTASRARYWIDKATLLILKTESYNAQGQWDGGTSFATLKVNESIDSSAFKLKLPDAAWRNGETLMNQYKLRTIARQMTTPLAFLGNTELKSVNLDLEGLLAGVPEYDPLSQVVTQPFYATSDSYGPAVVTLLEYNESNGPNKPFQNSRMPFQPEAGTNSPVGNFLAPALGMDGVVWKNGDDLGAMLPLYGTRIILYGKESATLNVQKLGKLARGLVYMGAVWYTDEIDAIWASIQEGYGAPLYHIKTPIPPNTTGARVHMVAQVLGRYAQGEPVYDFTHRYIWQPFYDFNSPTMAFSITQSMAQNALVRPATAKNESNFNFTDAFSYSENGSNFLVIRRGAVTITLQGNPKLVAVGDLISIATSLTEFTEVKQ